MDTGICDIQTIINPSRKYAKTVNLVFFRAYPLYKNFQIYVDGLNRWKEYKQYFPDCQLQIFVDQSIADDDSIMKTIHELDARVFFVKCPEYAQAEKYHIGIFPMFWRLFPAFDVFDHPFKVSHSQELEPEEGDISWFPYMDSVGKLKYPNLGFVHRTGRLFDKADVTGGMKFEGIIPYPKVFGGRVIICQQAPFSVLSDFFEKANKGQVSKLMYDSSKVKPEHGKYPFGIDETFLNTDYLEWNIKEGRAIGVMTQFKPSYPVYFLKKRVLSNPKSKEIMDYILQKKQSLKDSLEEFDKLFYKHDKNPERAKECADRFYEIIDKYPGWLGKEYTLLVQKAFYGFVNRICIIMIRDNKIEDVIDLK
jgi:hypothetical protein